jgi:ribosomal protein L6P/L9E
MKFVYAHFPINYNVTDGPTGKNTVLEIRNFIGEKLTRRITMQKGCIVERTANKDEIAITGNDLDMVSISAAQVLICTSLLNLHPPSHRCAGSAILHRQEPRFAQILGWHLRQRAPRSWGVSV